MPKDDFIGVLIWIVRFLLKTELVHNQFINHSSLSAQFFSRMQTKYKVANN